MTKDLARAKTNKNIETFEILVQRNPRMKVFIMTVQIKILKSTILQILH